MIRVGDYVEDTEAAYRPLFGWVLSIHKDGSVSYKPDYAPSNPAWRRWNTDRLTSAPHACVEAPERAVTALDREYCDAVLGGT